MRVNVYGMVRLRLEREIGGKAMVSLVSIFLGVVHKSRACALEFVGHCIAGDFIQVIRQH